MPMKRKMQELNESSINYHTKGLIICLFNVNDLLTDKQKVIDCKTKQFDITRIL